MRNQISYIALYCATIILKDVCIYSYYERNREQLVFPKK